MTVLDIILIGVFVVGAIRGIMVGAIKQIASLLGLVVGLLAAKALYGMLAEKLYDTVTTSMTFAQVLSFVLIWVLVPIAFAVIASLLTKAMSVICLGWLNRWLGAGIGALKYVLFASLFICVFEFVDADNELLSKDTKKSSVLYYPVQQLAGIFVPVATDIAHDIMNR